MSVLAKTKEVLAEAARLNPQLNNFLSIEHEASLEKAEYLDSVPAERPMHGRAIAVKDNICTRGMRTSCGSRILENYKAHYDATAVERLNDSRMAVARPFLIGTMGTNIEVLAGAGELVQARGLAEKLLKYEPTAEAHAMVGQHLARAGQSGLLERAAK